MRKSIGVLIVVFAGLTRGDGAGESRECDALRNRSRWEDVSAGHGERDARLGPQGD